MSVTTLIFGGPIASTPLAQAHAGGPRGLGNRGSYMGASTRGESDGS